MTRAQIAGEIAVHKSAIKDHQAEIRALEDEKPDRLTVEGVYGKSLAEVMTWCPGFLPLLDNKGLPCVRSSIRGEWVAANTGGRINPLQDTYGLGFVPRLILVPKPKKQQLVFPVLDEGRPAKEGELYQMDISGLVHRATYGHDYLSMRILGEPRLEDGE